MSDIRQVELNRFAVGVADAFKADRAVVGNVGDLNTVETTLVGAINAALASVPTGVLFSANNLGDVADVGTARTNLGVMSSADIAAAIAAVTLGSLGGLTQAEVDARVEIVVGMAPEALDTIAEISAALGDNPDFAQVVTDGLANKVDFSKVQTLTPEQQLQVGQNIGMGDPAADFLATFNTALNS